MQKNRSQNQFQKQLNQKQWLGKQGEMLLKQQLTSKGYRFIAQNFNTRFGEIDLIYEDGDVLVFIEVKTRNGTAYGQPEEAVSAAKLTKLRKAAEIFLVKHPKYATWQLRIDVAAVLYERKRVEPLVRYYENVF